MGLFNLKKKGHFTAAEILTQLDNCASDYIFPMLDNGYVYPVTSKLSSYRDDQRWVIVIEVFGYNYRGGVSDGISNCLHVFGNCIDYPPGTYSGNFLYPIDQHAEQAFHKSDDEELLNPKAKKFLLRNQELVIQHHRAHYEQRGIDLESKEEIYIYEFLRGLLPEHQQALLAKESEIKDRIPSDLPSFIALEEWNHPDCAAMEIPSENESFILLSKALESGNKDLFKPTLSPNNHWSHWPEGGKL